jgi:phosphopantetheinyl transferase
MPKPAQWAERRSSTRPAFVKGWRKAVKTKMAQARAARPLDIARSGMVDIWIAEPDALMRAESSLAVLTQSDWTQINRLQDPARRRSAVAARVVLRIALSLATQRKVQPSEWRFNVAANSRPVISEGLPSIHFSVSHLDEVIMAAVSANREIGIDVECIDQNLSKDVIAGFSHLDEQHAVGGLPRPQEIREFVRLWTLKEAYTKLLGTGHQLDFKSIKFTLDPVQLSSVADEKAGTVQFESFFTASNHLLFYASLAIQHPPGDLGTTEIQIISLAGDGADRHDAAPLAG